MLGWPLTMRSTTDFIVSFWSKLLHGFIPKNWNLHGLAYNVVLDLNKLFKFYRYKVSDVMLIDNFTSKSVDADDPINLICTLKPGGIYTKSQLQEQLRYLHSWDNFFETLYFESKTKPDGTIGITISFAELCLCVSDSVKFINVGLMDQRECTTSKKEPQKTSMEKYVREECGYNRRIDMSRPCMLPASTQREISDMLVVEGYVNSRLLLKIHDRVTRWYVDKGYRYADVMHFWNSDTNELVCEVIEGDITQVVLELYDVCWNVVCEGKPEYEEVRKELGKYLSVGKVFKDEAAEQATNYLRSLALFSDVEVKRSYDEKNWGGILIKIILQESEQQPA